MIFNPKEGGRLVLPVDDGSLVIDVKSARVAHHTSSMREGDARSVIKLDCDLIGTVVLKDTQDTTEAIILHGERDDPDAIVLSTKHLTDVNVSTNFPGSTEITIEAWGLPIQYSKLVERALQEKKVPDSRILMPQFVLDKMQSSLMSSGDHSHLGVVTGYTLTSDQLPGITGQHIIRPSPTKSVKVWPRVATDEEILNDKED